VLRRHCPHNNKMTADRKDVLSFGKPAGMYAFTKDQSSIPHCPQPLMLAAGQFSPDVFWPARAR
jgi:hypothetical protein